MDTELLKAIKEIYTMEFNQVLREKEELKEKVKIYRKNNQDLNAALRKRNKDISDYDEILKENIKLNETVEYLQSNLTMFNREIVRLQEENRKLRHICSNGETQTINI